MGGHWGPGPVFALEWLTASRRWQFYVGRVLFVGLLLAALARVWISQVAGNPAASIHEQAATGALFFRAIVFTQFILILVVSPTATAGVICLDRERGNLLHLMVTDLSNAEVVLGKLAGRLVPILGMVFGSLPVLAMGSLLGGIDPGALWGAFAIEVAMAVLCCAIALAFSTRGTKTYEVVLATMGVQAIWLLFTPIWWTLANLWGHPKPPRWAMAIQPFDLAMGRYLRPGEVGWIDYLCFCGGATLIAAVLIVASVAQIRGVVVRTGDGSRSRSRGSGQADHLARLDRDPAGWYERHRRRLTPWMRGMVATYFAFAIGFAGLAIWDGLERLPGKSYGWFPAYVVGFSVAFGLPLILLTAATATVDERARGSLDVLLATPIPTRAVVLAKWWSAFRQVGWLWPIPTLIVVPLAWNSGRWGLAALLPLSIVTWGASAASVGLALSTWFARPTRAVTAAVTLYGLISLGWPILVMTAMSSPGGDYWALTEISPFYAGFFVTCHSGGIEYYPVAVEWGGWAWALAHATTAVVLLMAVLRTFDRALGRVPDQVQGPWTHRPSNMVARTGASESRSRR